VALPSQTCKEGLYFLDSDTLPDIFLGDRREEGAKVSRNSVNRKEKRKEDNKERNKEREESKGFSTKGTRREGCRTQGKETKIYCPTLQSPNEAIW
jgi:hypothetical protein